MVGEKLVGKESKHEEYLNMKFHKDFCKTQAEAEKIALLFNRRLQGESSWQVHFLPCSVYEVKDQDYPKGIAWVLAEPELEGRCVRVDECACARARAIIV